VMPLDVAEGLSDVQEQGGRERPCSLPCGRGEAL